jgi:acyl-CoA dehydrogenase
MDEVRALQDAVRRVYIEELAPLEARWTRQAKSIGDMAPRGGRGSALRCIESEYGGLGGTFAHEAMIYYEQFRAGLPSFGNTLHTACGALHRGYGSEAQKRRWLPRLATGEWVAAWRLSEPGAGSDLRSHRTTAVRHGDEYVSERSEDFITNGLQADLVCLAVRHDHRHAGRRTVAARRRGCGDRVFSAAAGSTRSDSRARTPSSSSSATLERAVRKRARHGGGPGPSHR